MSDSYKISFPQGEDKFFTEEELGAVQIINETEKLITLQYQNKIYNISVDSFHPDSKKYKLLINDRLIQLKLNDSLDQMLHEMGLDKKTEESISVLEAPMPGLVIDVLVSPGDEIEKGTPLIVLEAMKMENIIKSSGKAVVKETKVIKGDKVDKSQLLILFE